MKEHDESTSSERFIQLRSAADMLGLSLRTLYRVVSEARLKIIKVRGCACVASSELGDYMKQCMGEAGR